MSTLPLNIGTIKLSYLLAFFSTLLKISFNHPMLTYPKIFHTSIGTFINVFFVFFIAVTAALTSSSLTKSVNPLLHEILSKAYFGYSSFSNRLKYSFHFFFTSSFVKTLLSSLFIHQHF